MKKTERIFVIGHKNPDTDSICSAIAYADIKNRTTQNKKYIPKRAGQINEETRYVLNRFGVQPPAYLGNIGTQVKDMDIRTSPQADKNMSLKNTWDLMQENGIVSLPIRDKDGCLEGLVTIGDIAKTYMDTTDSYLLSNARTQYQRIAETVGGEVVEGNGHGYFVKGRVLVGTANPKMLEGYVEENDMIIMGDREEDHLQAISQNVSCIIVGLNIVVSEKVVKLAHEKNIVIIRSPYDTFNIARLINQSIPVSFVMKRDNMVTFNTEDFTDDIQDVMIKNRHRAFPVINPHGKCIGTISRRNFLDMHKKKVVLVDHNEVDQAVDNIEKAEILEIIDHHKLGTLQTMTPVAFRNEPVGCTGTILYEIYGEQRLEIPEKIAVRGDDPVGAYYTPLGTDGKPAVFLKAKPKTDPEKCTKCGICATVCPMGSIPKDAPDTCTGICIKCQACILGCPRGAKFFDDEQFLSHARMLEQKFAGIHKENEFYL